MLKHGMILSHRGVSARGYDIGDVLEDKNAMKDVAGLAHRLYELAIVEKGR